MDSINCMHLSGYFMNPEALSHIASAKYDLMENNDVGDDPWRVETRPYIEV